MDVLLCLAAAAGEVVERETILRTVWGERAPTDEPLTRCIGDLRRAFGDKTDAPTYILTVPKRGYRILQPVVSAEIEDDASAPVLTAAQARLRTNTLKKIGIGAVVLIVAALIEVFIERGLDSIDEDQVRGDTSVEESIGPPERSIAVLPFVNMSTDREQDYFSDGISEELLNMLARVPELSVISRTSAFSYKGRQVDIPTIATQLNVAYVLEGSVRKSGDEVRITAQLIDARSDTHVWSENFDRTLDDIFAVQEQIAADVAAQLKVSLLGAGTAVYVTDPEAYALVLQARHVAQQFSPDALERSIDLLEQALLIDPMYAAAWDGLARAYTDLAGQGHFAIDEGYTLARQAAGKALAIDPSYAPAHARLSWIAQRYDRDMASAARHYARALALDPTNTHIIGNAANMARSLGRMNDAIALAEYAAERDPVSATRVRNLALAYFYGGRLTDAIASFRTVLVLSPNQIGAHYFIATAMLLAGKPEAALTEIQAEPDEGWQLIGAAMIHHALGNVDTAYAVFAELIEKFEQDAAYNIAHVAAFRNEADLAFEWLDKAVAYNDPGLSGISTNPLFANIQSDERWLPFLRSIGKSSEQLAAIDFVVTLPE